MNKIRRKTNLYRSSLDPRDPEYEDLWEDEEDDEPPFDVGEVWDGPYHYIPKGNH